MQRAGAFAVLIALMSNLAFAQARLEKPRLPPGRDPGGVMIGLMTTGLDPSRPDVAKCLARDGEGELIGWDVVDRDRAPLRPLPADQTGDETFFVGLPCGRVRIVPVRVDAADPVSIGKALAFLSTTPVRLVVVPPNSQPANWGPFRQATSEFRQLTVILARDALPDGVDAPNVVALSPATAMPMALKSVLCTGSPQPADPVCR